MDVDQSHNTEVRTAYNISGFPTIYYFVEGKVKYTYTGEKDKDGIVKWMKDPTPPKEPEKVGAMIRQTLSG
jgi:protein disulfide isomerase family A protein 5